MDTIDVIDYTQMTLRIVQTPWEISSAHGMDRSLMLLATIYPQSGDLLEKPKPNDIIGFT